MPIAADRPGAAPLSRAVTLRIKRGAKLLSDVKIGRSRVIVGGGKTAQLRLKNAGLADECLVIDTRESGGRPMRRMEDFHTVQNTRTADGKIKETHITRRTYLNDAAFAALLSGDAAMLDELKEALADPVWGVWLGRKACIPSAPVLAGVFETEDAALERVLNGQPLTAYTHQREVNAFADGNDTFMDTPITFADPREFTPRRVKLVRAGGST